MKAKQNFVVYLDKNENMTPYYSGESKEVKELKFKVNDEAPDILVADLIKTNPDYLQVEYASGQFKLTEEEKKRFNLVSGKIERPPLVPPRKYSQDSLTKILNEKGVGELKKIAEEEFGMEVEKASKTLLTKILLEQEQRRRNR